MPSGLRVERIEIRSERPRPAAVGAAERERHALLTALCASGWRKRIEMRVQIDESRRDDESVSRR